MSSTQPQVKSLKQLRESVDFYWFVSHSVVVASTLLGLVFSRQARVATALYRVAFAAAIASFAIITHQKYGNKLPSSVSILGKDENLQYLFISVLFLFTSRRILAVLPVAIFSLFHVLTYLRSYLLPAMHYSETSTPVQTIHRFIQSRNEPLTLVAAHIELLLYVQLAILAVLFKKSSWIQLTGYAYFFYLRYAGSFYTRKAVKTWEIWADKLTGHPSMPPAVKQYWVQAKGALRHAGSKPAPASSTSTTTGTPRASGTTTSHA